ncbi:MAG: DUF1467 family protein [Rhodovarius sp.]|nr:DUF1467 family protein [Rhodovarius sp.]MDW8314871.1 DUF1467 family protein [Rhodovarius sp.]
MNWFTGLVVFVLVWWTALFIALPIGVRPDATGESTPGGWRGAPLQPRLGQKLAITTVIAVVVWLGIWWLTGQDWASFRSGLFAMPE